MSDNDIRARVEGCFDRMTSELEAAKNYLSQTGAKTFNTAQWLKQVEQGLEYAKKNLALDLQREDEKNEDQTAE